MPDELPLKKPNKEYEDYLDLQDDLFVMQRYLLEQERKASTQTISQDDFEQAKSNLQQENSFHKAISLKMEEPLTQLPGSLNPTPSPNSLLKKLLSKDNLKSSDLEEAIDAVGIINPKARIKRFQVNAIEQFDKFKEKHKEKLDEEALDKEFSSLKERCQNLQGKFKEKTAPKFTQEFSEYFDSFEDALYRLNKTSAETSKDPAEAAKRVKEKLEKKLIAADAVLYLQEQKSELLKDRHILVIAEALEELGIDRSQLESKIDQEKINEKIHEIQSRFDLSHAKECLTIIAHGADQKKSKAAIAELKASTHLTIPGKKETFAKFIATNPKEISPIIKILNNQLSSDLSYSYPDIYQKNVDIFFSKHPEISTEKKQDIQEKANLFKDRFKELRELAVKLDKTDIPSDKKKKITDGFIRFFISTKGGIRGAHDVFTNQDIQSSNVFQGISNSQERSLKKLATAKVVIELYNNPEHRGSLLNHNFKLIAQAIEDGEINNSQNINFDQLIEHVKYLEARDSVIQFKKELPVSYDKGVKRHRFTPQKLARKRRERLDGLYENAKELDKHKADVKTLLEKLPENIQKLYNEPRSGKEVISGKRLLDKLIDKAYKKSPLSQKKFEKYKKLGESYIEKTYFDKKEQEQQKEQFNRFLHNPTELYVEYEILKLQQDVFDSLSKQNEIIKNIESKKGELKENTKDTKKLKQEIKNLEIQNEKLSKELNKKIYKFTKIAPPNHPDLPNFTTKYNEQNPKLPIRIYNQDIELYNIDRLFNRSEGRATLLKKRSSVKRMDNAAQFLGAGLGGITGAAVGLGVGTAGGAVRKGLIRGKEGLEFALNHSIISIGVKGAAGAAGALGGSLEGAVVGGYKGVVLGSALGAAAGQKTRGLGLGYIPGSLIGLYTASINKRQRNALRDERKQFFASVRAAKIKYRDNLEIIAKLEAKEEEFLDGVAISPKTKRLIVHADDISKQIFDADKIQNVQIAKKLQKSLIKKLGPEALPIQELRDKLEIKESLSRWQQSQDLELHANNLYEAFQARKDPRQRFTSWFNEESTKIQKDGPESSVDIKQIYENNKSKIADYKLKRGKIDNLKDLNSDAQFLSSPSKATSQGQQPVFVTAQEVISHPPEDKRISLPLSDTLPALAQSASIATNLDRNFKNIRDAHKKYTGTTKESADYIELQQAVLNNSRSIEQKEVGNFEFRNSDGEILVTTQMVKSLSDKGDAVPSLNPKDLKVAAGKKVTKVSIMRQGLDDKGNFVTDPELAICATYKKVGNEFKCDKFVLPSGYDLKLENEKGVDVLAETRKSNPNMKDQELVEKYLKEHPDIDLNGINITCQHPTKVKVTLCSLEEAKTNFRSLEQTQSHAIAVEIGEKVEKFITPIAPTVRIESSPESLKPIEKELEKKRRSSISSVPSVASNASTLQNALTSPTPPIPQPPSDKTTAQKKLEDLAQKAQQDKEISDQDLKDLSIKLTVNADYKQIVKIGNIEYSTKDLVNKDKKENIIKSLKETKAKKDMVKISWIAHKPQLTMKR